MKIICIGRNYEEHIKELNNEKPLEPVFFLKPDTSILPKNHPFFIPEYSNDVHYEVEVLVKISKVGKYVSEKFAHKYYNEISLGIDFTCRDIQEQLKNKGLPWEKAKAFDGAAVIGNFVSKSQIQNLNNLHFQLFKNNELVQYGNTQNMIFKIDEVITHISRYMTLKIGDIIFTGTPSGVGAIKANDILKGVLNGEKSFEIKIK